MNPERWQQFKQIFQAALDLPLSDRPAYVQEACGDDEELFRDIFSLLESEERSADFLGEAAAEYVSGAFEDRDLPDTNVGRRTGPYQIVRKIGAGGMGAVYLAERVDEFRQKVALKLLKRDFASREVIARFRHERQILAGLDHPYLARLLDGGATDDGHPYFVMEYVEGASIDSYCHNRALSITERLHLFRRVCAAVQYAHQNLIVHRDIKPGNILVTEDGTPKLLDFGIAKLLRQEDAKPTAALTEAGMRLMTPEYASPEQVRGLPITTVTDVYSLGIVLYELLSGRLPYEFRTRSASEIERAICEQDPPRPSAVAAPAVSHRLAGDLDTVVLKAIEKEPLQRYQSVEELSEDIRRHLERMPITARPQTLRYRASRFARRNRTAVFAGIVVLLSLTGGLIATAWQTHVARFERARAERRFNDVRNLAESLLLDVHDKFSKEGPTEARQALVGKALEYLNILEKEAVNDPSLQLDLAEGYLRLGDVQGNPFSSGKADPTGALARYDKALQLAQGVARNEPRNDKALRTQARASRLRGDVLMLLGKDQDAVASVHKSIEGLQTLIAAHPDDLESRAELSHSFEALGDKLNPGLSGLQDINGATDAYRKALQVWDELLTRNPKEPGAPRALAVLNMKLGDMQTYSGSEDVVRSLYSKALASLHAANLQDVDNLSLDTTIRRKLASLDSEKHPAEAAAHYRTIVALREKLLAADNKNSRKRIDLVVVLLDFGHVQEKLPDGWRGAIDCYRRAWDLLTPLREADPDNVMMQDMAADTGIQLARALTHVGKREEAGRAAAQALEIYRHLVERDGSASWLYSEYADVLLHVAPSNKRNPAVALKYAQLASAAEQGKNFKYLELIAEAYFQSGRTHQAATVEQEALSLLPPGSPDRTLLEQHLKQYRGASGK